MAETTQIICRIDKDLKAAFERIAESEDQTVSQMIRAYIRWEVQKHAGKNAQQDLFQAPSAPKQKKEAPQPKEAKKQPVEGKKALLDMFKKR